MCVCVCAWLVINFVMFDNPSCYLQEKNSEQSTQLHIHTYKHTPIIFKNFHLPLYFFDLMWVYTSFQSLFLILNFNIVSVIHISAVRMTRADGTTDIRLTTLNNRVTQSPPIPPKSYLPSRKSMMYQSVTYTCVRNWGRHVYHIRPLVRFSRRNSFASETESLAFWEKFCSFCVLDTQDI